MSPPIQYSETASCTLCANVSHVPRALSNIRAYFTQRGLPSSLWSGIELPLAEALNNAITHGSQSDPSQTVTISWSWSGEEACFHVSDAGHFTPPEVAPPTLPDDPLTEGGRGLYLIHSMVDSVHHTNSPDGHCIHLTKKLSYSPKQLEDFVEMENTLEAMTSELSASYENVSALFHFGELLATSANYEEFANRALLQLLQLLSCGKITLRRLSSEGLLKCVSHQSSKPTENSPHHIAPYDPASESRCYESGKELPIPDCSRLPAADPLHTEKACAYVYPMRFQEKSFGTLSIQCRQRKSFFTAAEINLGRVVADYLAIATATAGLQKQREIQQRSIREIEIASNIQASLLPREFPNHPVFEIFGTCKPALQVGGDFFDVITSPDGSIHIIIADVMGKGVPSSLLAATLRTAIRSHVHTTSSPGQLIEKANRQIYEDLERVGMFITAQCLWLKPDGLVLEVSSAGHCPLLIRRSGKIELEHGESMPLGLSYDETFKDHQIQLSRGDGVLMITDGIYELFGSRKTPLGIDNLTALLEKAWIPPPQAFCHYLIEALKDEAQSSTADDDQTLVSIEVKP